MAKNSQTNNSIQTVGRRKTASARVRLLEGKEEHTVNGKPISAYFPGELMKSIYEAPFRTLDVTNFYMTAKVSGGGIWGQVQAVAHGLSRALVKHNPDWKPTLRQQGLVTRDSRMKERRKAGLAQSARARKSSPKR